MSLPTDDSPDSPARVLVRATSLAKSFGATRALRDCSFELRAGEVHALVGENGSGKSTLVKLLSGLYGADSGQIEVSGETVRLRSPIQSQRRGIATVFQEVLVAQTRSVYHNVWLGADGLLRAKVSASRKRKRAAEIMGELLGRDVDLSAIVEDLPLSDRQACCIARAILREPKVLILDEATSALDIATRDRLFALVTRMAQEGAGVIFITHRMDELAELGDRITVMRSGTTVDTVERDKWTTRQLVHLMTGQDSFTEGARAAAERSMDNRVGRIVLTTKNLELVKGKIIADVEIHEGELIGVAGLEGHGQHEFLEALRGTPGFGGYVIYDPDGAAKPVTSPVQAAREGIAYVPRERGVESLFPWMSIKENFALPTLEKDTRFGLIRPLQTSRRLKDYITRLNITLGHDSDRITTLSGGNQQKVIIARWLAAEPKVLLLNDPTRGIDVGAKADVYALLTSLAAEGVAIVMLSTEVDEHVELVDRALVFREHELSCEIRRGDLTRNALVAAFFGEEEADQSVSADATSN
jgi:ABC-type sugar transport system ATPase subunit